MPNWYWDKKDILNSPSARAGIDHETENRYRREAVKFINDVGASLNLRYDTMATAAVYFHRFFMFHSFKDFSRHVTALGCLFLAGKVEETPKKCRDLVRIAQEKLTEQQFNEFGNDPKEEVMCIERVLLQTIKFDLQVEHPYAYLLKYAKVVKGDKVKLNNMVQMAWTFINDSLCTTLCLQWQPEIIAIALMYLASRLSKFEVLDWTGNKNQKGEKWWDQFVANMSMDLLEGSEDFDICHTILDLYSTNPKDKGKPSIPGISSSSAASALSATTSSSAGQTSQNVVARSDATKLPTVVPTMAKTPITATTPVMSTTSTPTTSVIPPPPGTVTLVATPNIPPIPPPPLPVDASVAYPAYQYPQPPPPPFAYPAPMPPGPFAPGGYPFPPPPAFNMPPAALPGQSFQHAQYYANYQQGYQHYR